MLSCQELTEIVTDYLEGRMSFMQRLSFQMHVGMCRHCRTYLRQMRATVQALGALPAEAVSRGMPEAVQRELMQRLHGLRASGGRLDGADIELKGAE